MESQKNISLAHTKILKTLSNLPVKMLTAHHHEKLSDLVLYELAHPNCFNFLKVAFIVDNPNFQCLHGVTGFNKNEYQPLNQTSAWDNTESFHKALEQSPFHQKVRSIRQCGTTKPTHKEPEKLKELAENLTFEQPSFYTWQMKHENYGILLFEHEDATTADPYDTELLQGLSLLGFCPIY